MPATHALIKKMHTLPIERIAEVEDSWISCARATRMARSPARPRP